MVLLQVDKPRAIRIGKGFLEQHHSDIFPIDATLEEDIWVVTLSIGLADPKKRTVRVNAKTDSIVYYS